MKFHIILQTLTTIIISSLSETYQNVCRRIGTLHTIRYTQLQHIFILQLTIERIFQIQPPGLRFQQKLLITTANQAKGERAQRIGIRSAYGGYVMTRAQVFADIERERSITKYRRAIVLVQHADGDLEVR